MENRVLLIIGASSDMGIELIKTTHMKYDHIIAHYNKTDQYLMELKSKLGDKLRLYKADLKKLEEVQLLLEKIKEDGFLPTHIVHLPADKYYLEKFKKTSWDRFQTNIDISLRSAVMILKSFIPDMEKNRYGKVVILLSSYTNNNPPKYLSYYGTVKYALLGLVKGLASEYADKGISINGVSPSMVETKMLSEVSEIVIAQNAMDNPRGKNLQVVEVVPTIDFLLSVSSDSITGQNIVITGGQ